MKAEVPRQPRNRGERDDAAQGSADLSLRIAVTGIEELTRLLARLKALPGVLSARRRA